MDEIKILIVEDDMIIAADISMQLTQMGYEITGILPRGEDALDNVAQNKPDIVLMDINLKGEMDGVQTAQQIYGQYKIPIIYLTANADEATFKRAKVTRPEAFISKPFKRIDLARALELVVDKIQGADLEEAHAVASASIQDKGNESFLLDDRIFVRFKDRMVKIYIKEILFAEAERNYCRIQSANKEYLMTVPLKIFEQRLNSDQFIKVHRSYVINITKIDEVADTYVVMAGHKVPVSKSNKEALLNRLKLF